MADESKQHWLSRNRPPRVQITYDVETGGAIEKKEIPFVVGIMSDLTGAKYNPDAGKALPKMKERKFVEIDRDNFNKVMASIKPAVTMKVPDMIGDPKPDGSRGVRQVDLVFSHINDFTPERVVEQYKDLRELLEARRKLNDLLGKLEGNDELSSTLLEILKNTEDLNALKAALT